MTHAPTRHASTVRSHWWWRPGWGPGRRAYAWHINAGLEPLHGVARAYHDAVAHLPLDQVGFVDETSDDDLAAIFDGEPSLTRNRWPDPADVRSADPASRGAGDPSHAGGSARRRA